MSGIGRVGNQINIDNNRSREAAAKKPEVKVETAEVAFKNSKTGDGEMRASIMRAQITRAFDTRSLVTNAEYVPPTSGQTPTAPNNQTPATPNAQTPPVDQAKVDDALKTIRERLSEGITDWDVSHGDLKEIENQFKNLNSAELNRAFEQMSPDELKKYASELNGDLGGYNAEEKKELFDHFAKNLNGANLSRLASAMDLGEESSSVRPGQTAEPDVNILARSIAENASPEAKAEFVKNLAAQADKHQNAGVAAAQVLAGMKNNPALLNSTLKELDDSGRLSSVVDAAARKTEVSTRGGTITNYDPQPLRDLLDAAATLQGSNVTRQQTRLFELAANKITEIRDNARFATYYGQPAEDLIRGGLTNILNNNTGGVVGQLEINNNGAAMTAYLKSALNAGENDQVRQFINRLTTGNPPTNPTEFIEQNSGTPDKPIYQNARSLGFFAGSLFSASRQITGDANKQAEIIKNVLGVALGAGGAANPASGVVASLANGLTAEAARRLLDGVNGDHARLQEEFFKLFLPPGADGNPYSGTAKEAFNGSFSITALRNGFN